MDQSPFQARRDGPSFQAYSDDNESPLKDMQVRGRRSCVSNLKCLEDRLRRQIKSLGAILCDSSFEG
jgi:hypothetical protein